MQFAYIYCIILQQKCFERSFQEGRETAVNRTTLVDRRIVSLVMQGIPDDLAEETIKGHLNHAADLHQALRALLHADLTRVDAQQLKAILQGLAIGPETYADEEIKSKYSYPQGFTFKTAAEKLLVLAKHFPELDGSYIGELADGYSRTGQLQSGEEELLVWPKPSRVAGNYNEALIQVLEMLGSTRPFQNWRDGQLGPELLRLTEKTAAALAKLEVETPGDYLVIPVQMGLRHRGRSVRRARVCMEEKEFGLGPLEVACYLLSCPERFGRWEDLAIDCAGVEYRLKPDGEFASCLYFCFDDGELHLGRRWADDTPGYFGSASGFLR